MIITIGKANDNDYVVNDVQVSRHHARLLSEPDGTWLLEDLDSTNGTFVNDTQVMRKRVTKGDRIRLGERLTISLNDLLKAGNDYSEEFAKLKVVYDQYIQEKVRIQSSNQLKTRLLQSLPFALPGVIGVVIGFFGKGNTTLFGLSLLITIIAPTIGIYLGARQAAKIPKQLQELANRFKIDYVCPKCGAFLGEIPWESLLNRRQCPVSSCQAKWAKDTAQESLVH